MFRHWHARLNMFLMGETAQGVLLLEPQLVAKRRNSKQFKVTQVEKSLNRKGEPNRTNQIELQFRNSTRIPSPREPPWSSLV